MRGYCPLMSYHREQWHEVHCMSKDCVLADEAGNCLIKQALQCYVSESRTRQAREKEFTRNYVGTFVNLNKPDDDSSCLPF